MKSLGFLSFFYVFIVKTLAGSALSAFFYVFIAKTLLFSAFSAFSYIFIAKTLLFSAFSAFSMISVKMNEKSTTQSNLVRNHRKS